jgi:hypothetical protein
MVPRSPRSRGPKPPRSIAIARAQRFEGPWNHGTRAPCDPSRPGIEASKGTSRQQRLGTFIPSTALVPWLDWSLDAPGPEFSSWPIKLGLTAALAVAAPRRRWCLGPRAPMVDGPAWSLEGQGVEVLDAPGYQGRRWVSGPQVSCRLLHLGCGTSLMPGRLLYQDIRAFMAYWSRGGRIALKPWSRFLRQIKLPMSTMGHGPVRPMPRMAPR